MAELTPTDLAQLRRLVTAYFAEHLPQAEVGEWVVRIGGRAFGLVNLFQTAAEVGPEEWEELIEWHFDSIRQVRIQVPEDYEKAAPRLRVRLADADIAGGHHSRSVRQVCEGLFEVLMVRVDHGAFTCPPWAWESWEVDPDQVWADALSHTSWDEPRERGHLTSPEGRRVSWIGDGFYASSMLLDLDRFLPVSQVDGVLAMVPRNDALLYVPVDHQVIEACRAMMDLGGLWFVEGPHAISPDVFWRRGGRIDRVVRWSEQRYEITWGRDFSTVLAKLDERVRQLG